MLSDGTSAIVYQVNKDGGENAEVFCAVLDENGNIVDSPKLTKNEIRDENPQITALIFPDGVERFVIGRNSVKNVDGEDENIISLSAVNGGGILYPQFEKEIENTAEPSNYKRFRFSKGADNPEDLSIVWVERETESDDIHRDNIWGRKFITSDDGDITLSPKIKLLKLDDNNAVDFYDCYVNSGTKEINFALLTTEESYAEVQSELSVARVSYKNNLVVKEADFSREDLLPGTDMPVMFRLYNDGVERIEGVTINIAGVPHAFDGEDFVIQPGEYKDFTVLYPVPESVCNPDYSITAQFTTVSDVKSGTLIMDIPDTGIYNIELTKQAGRERGFSVWLCNNSVSKLTEGRHAVTLEVYNTPSFNNAPVMTRTFSDAENLNKINDGMLIQEILLSEVEIKSILDDNGEIPEDGARIYFNTVLSENGAVIDDADISNNSDYVRLNSLLKERKPVSVTTLMHAEPDRTVVKVEAFNNSMNEITNGNIVVNLRDENGDIIETRQTFASEGADTGVITLAGEEAFEATFEFSETGAYNDAVFTTVADGGALLSELKLSGVPVDFDKNIYDYSAQVTGLHETLLTVVPENPDSVITITNNGNHVSNGRCPLVYGENNIEISVRKDINDVKYTVSIQNIRDGDDTCTISAIKGIDKPVAGKIPVSTITETEQYTGSVTWSGSPETFGYDTVYTATITLTPKDGYTVTGIGGNFFTVEHASSVTNPSDSGVITAVFPKTASRPSPTPTTSSNTSKRSAQNYNTIYQNPFEDVSETDWFYQAVQFAYENNLMKGTGANTFNPNLHTTRGMLVTILYRMEGEPSIEPSGFSDVAEDEYYANAIAWARKNGIVKGVSETRFEPDIGITREQAAVILHRYAGFKGVDTSKRVELSGYSDSGTISDYALPAMEWAVGTGLINGRSATITAPRENITRAEVCAVLQRFLNAL